MLEKPFLCGVSHIVHCNSGSQPSPCCDLLIHFLMLWRPSAIRLFLLLFYKCNFATEMNVNVNIVGDRSLPTGWEPVHNNQWLNISKFIMCQVTNYYFSTIFTISLGICFWVSCHLEYLIFKHLHSSLLPIKALTEIDLRPRICRLWKIWSPRLVYLISQTYGPCFS